MVKESNASNPLIYINNPVETKVPHAYLTFEEFKKELTDRVMVLRQQFDENVDKAVHQNLNMSKEKSLNNDESKKFKIFLNRLMNLPGYKKAHTIANEKKSNQTAKITKMSKVKSNQTAKVTKPKSKVKNNQTAKITRTNSKENNSRTLKITEKTKVHKPMFRLFTLATDAKRTVKNTKQPTPKKEAKSEQTTDTKTEQAFDKTETITVEMETTARIESPIESLTKTDATEPPTEPDLTKDSLIETPEPTREVEFDSTRAIITTTTEEITTKRSTLGVSIYL